MTTAAQPSRPRLAPEALLWIVFLAAALTAVVGFRWTPSFDPTWDMPWAVASGIAGAFVFWRLGRWGPTPVVLPGLLWFGAFASGIVHDHRTVDPAIDQWEWSAAAVSTLALVATLKPSRAIVVALLLVLVAATAIGTRVSEYHCLSVRRRWDVAVGAGTLLVARLAAARCSKSALTAALATIALSFSVRHVRAVWGLSFVVPWRRTDAEVVLATIHVGLAFVGGGLIRVLALPPSDSAGSRFAVFCSRRPWLTSLALAALFTSAIRRWPFTVVPAQVSWYMPSDLTLVFVAVGLAFTAHVLKDGQPRLDALAPWFVAGVASLALIVAPESPVGAVAILTSTLWPLVSAHLWEKIRAAVRRPVSVFVTQSTPVAIVIATQWSRDTSESSSTRTCETLLIPAAALAFHSGVTSRLPDAAIILLGAVAGYAAPMTRYGSFAPHWERGESMSDLLPIVLAGPVLGFIAGLLVVAARRCRSMTAVPRDHPIVEDFGGE